MRRRELLGLFLATQAFVSPALANFVKDAIETRPVEILIDNESFTCDGQRLLWNLDEAHLEKRPMRLRHSLVWKDFATRMECMKEAVALTERNQGIVSLPMNLIWRANLREECPRHEKRSRTYHMEEISLQLEENQFVSNQTQDVWECPWFPR